jgi:hypothetical protein
MIKFIKLMLGTNGEISSKRCMMVFFAVLFAYALVSNHLTGMAVDDTMKWQLFFLLLWAMSIVFGEKIPEIISAWTGKKTTTTTELKIEKKDDANAPR